MANPRKQATVAAAATQPTAGDQAQDAVAGVFGGQPSGVSPLWWNTTRHGPDAEAFRRKYKEEHWGVSPEDLDRATDQWAQQQWQNTPQETRDQWVEQDKKGSPYAPGSPGWAAEQQAEEGKTGLDQDLAAIDALGLDNLNELAKQAAEGDAAAGQALKDAFAKIQDPEIKAYVGDYVSQAAEARVSEATLAQQQKEFDKLSALTDPTITAAERKMMYDARKQQENDLRSQREAYANDLQARGMYGSGAELGMNLASAQEYANRRMGEEMTAQANAQNRAMEALKQANTVAGNIRTSEAQETQFRASAADKASEFNKKLQEDYNHWRTDAENRLNESRERRAKTIADYDRQTAQNKFKNTISTINTGLEGVKTRSDVRHAGQDVVDEARKMLGNTHLFGLAEKKGLNR